MISPPSPLPQRTLGILALIDEETKFPRATDKTLAHKLHKAHGGGRAGGEVYQAPPDGGLRFQVGHYAGTVEYQLAGFLEKNRDTLSSSLLMLMRSACPPACVLVHSHTSFHSEAVLYKLGHARYTALDPACVLG